MRALAAVAGSAVALIALGAATSALAQPASTAGRAHRAAHVCAVASPGSASCDAQVVVDSSGKPNVTGAPAGLGAPDIRAAYNLGTSSSGGRTVAIVDAYDDPTAESDLGVYRSQFGLLPCTTNNGCFRKVGQNGGALPKANAGWAAEISLDLDMVSATCPDCKILLVEASSTSFSSLGAAVNYAATQGVTAISNSYGGSDSGQLTAYQHANIAITASTGDSGYGVQSPASFDSVIAVGGTSLTRAPGTARGWAESAWSGAGSGCSSKNKKPAWQTSATQCPNGKANADVSAVADPNTGVSVFDSTTYQGRRGWQVYGGTSAASPIVASVYALSGNVAGNPASFTWGHSSALNDVTTGSNGTCSPAVWCTSGTGWDGPTGLGTPNGTAAF